MRKRGYRSRQWLRVAFLIFTVLSVLPQKSAIQAQQPSDPIILTLNGDLWSWEGVSEPLRQLTSWGLNDRPILSPDGTKVAYLSTARVWAEWQQRCRCGSGGYALPLNIWVLDVPSSQTFRVADQPPDARFDGPSDPRKYITRSSPEWSPDSRYLAWTDLSIDTVNGPDDPLRWTAQLVVFDLVNKTTHILASNLIPPARAEPIYVSWGKPGIALKVGVEEDYNRGSALDLLLYDISGKLLARIDLDVLPNVGLEWITYQDHSYLINTDEPDQWLNWSTAQAEDVPGAVEMYSLSAPNGASFFRDVDRWKLALPGQTPMALDDGFGVDAISRDGQSVLLAHTEYDQTTFTSLTTLVLRSADRTVQLGKYTGQLGENTGISGVVWGPIGWRIRPKT
jgi:hypothetical protein